MTEIDLNNIVTNSDNAREPSPKLQGLGYGIVEPIEGTGKPSLFALALGTPADKRKFIALIEQHDEGLLTLAQSIDQQGQLQNCQIRLAGKGQYALIIGCRRCLALLYLHAKNGRPATAWATNADTDDKTSVIASAAENIHLPPSYIDQAKLFKRMQNQGMEVKDIAKLIPMGKTGDQNIRHRLRLLELPHDIQLKVHHGKLSQDKALGLLKKPSRANDMQTAPSTQIQKPGNYNRTIARSNDDLQTVFNEFVKRLRTIDMQTLTVNEPDKLLLLAKEAGTIISAVKKELAKLASASAA